MNIKPQARKEATELLRFPITGPGYVVVTETGRNYVFFLDY